jgi:hypothetical protein
MITRSLGPPALIQDDLPSGCQTLPKDFAAFRRHCFCLTRKEPDDLVNQDVLSSTSDNSDRRRVKRPRRGEQDRGVVRGCSINWLPDIDSITLGKIGALVLWIDGQRSQQFINPTDAFLRAGIQFRPNLNTDLGISLQVSAHSIRGVPPRSPRTSWWELKNREFSNSWQRARSYVVGHTPVRDKVPRNDAFVVCHDLLSSSHSFVRRSI